MMSDTLKITLMAAASLLLVALFVGVGLDADNYRYFLSRRVPRVLALIIAAVAIAQSSLVFQTLTNNRILTPGIMGFDALYQATQLLLVLLLGGLSVAMANVYLNFALSVAVMMLFSLLLFGFYFNKQQAGIMTLLLLGVIFGQLFGSLSSFFMMLLDPTEFAVAQGKMFASFNNINGELVYLCLLPLALVVVMLYRQHRTLDVFWLDRDNAIGLGVDVKAVTKRVLLLIAVLVSVSTALVGPILFFGLLVANLSRQLCHSYQHRVLLVASSLLAVLMLLGGQWLLENLFSLNTTLSVVINFFGGLYFLWLLVRQKI